MAILYYDPAGKTDHAGKVTTYHYDGLGRLTSESETGGLTVSYTYDDNNNHKTMSIVGGAETSYEYDTNRLLKEIKLTEDITEITRYQYDNNGNQIFKGIEVIKPIVPGEPESIETLVMGQNETGFDTILYEYNGLNQLVKVIGDGITATYAYNGDGLRISKTVNGIVTQHVWDGNQMVLKLNGSGEVTNKYVRGINLFHAEDGTGANRKWYLYNGHGDVVQLTDNSGNVIKNYNYNAFGNERNPGTADSNVFRYFGEYFGKETGTYYLRAGYYAPGIGRFISEDSYWGSDSDPLTLNLYTYT